MQITHVVSACFVAELANGFKEREDLNVTYCSTHFRDDNISFVCGNSADTTLDFIGDVRNNLHGLSEIITTAFRSQNCLVNGTCCCIGTTCQILINESFIVTKVEVCFAAVISYEHFTMFKWIHRARVDVDVRIKLLHSDAQTAHLEQTTK